MTQTNEWETEAALEPNNSGTAYSPQVLAAFPPLLETDSQGSAYLVRFLLLGLGFGLLAGLSVVQLQWATAIGIGLLWVLGLILLGILAPVRAKQHRGGVGYPADPQAWVKTYTRVLTVGVFCLAVLSLGVALAVTFLSSNADGSAPLNYTPLILLAIVGAIGIFCLRWLLQNKLLWLVYGGR